MKILAIGDPHGDLRRIKKIPIGGVDLILITGDLGSADLMRKMSFENIRRREKDLSKKEFTHRQEKGAFMEAYNSSIKIVRYLSKFAPVMTIYGNVESSNVETKKISKEIGLSLPFLTDNLKKIKNVRIINNKLANFKSIRIGGLQYFIDTNWVKEFSPPHYKKRMKSAKKETDKSRRIMNNWRRVDILLHHQPPYGVLDKVTLKQAPQHWKGRHAGSKAILDYIKKYQPEYAFCGHIHEGEGFKKIGKTKVYNLGVCGYKIIEI